MESANWTTQVSAVFQYEGRTYQISPGLAFRTLEGKHIELYYSKISEICQIRFIHTFRLSNSNVVYSVRLS